MLARSVIGNVEGFLAIDTNDVHDKARVCFGESAHWVAGAEVLRNPGGALIPGFLQKQFSLMYPAADVPELFRVVELKTRSGTQVTGIRLNEDTWSIQVMDFGDRVHSFWKQDLAELRLERRTPMPSYKDRLNAEEVKDVVAYLVGLRGGQ